MPSSNSNSTRGAIYPSRRGVACETNDCATCLDPVPWRSARAVRTLQFMTSPHGVGSEPQESVTRRSANPYYQNSPQLPWKPRGTMGYLGLTLVAQLWSDFLFQSWKTILRVSNRKKKKEIKKTNKSLQFFFHKCCKALKLLT